MIALSNKWRVYNPETITAMAVYSDYGRLSVRRVNGVDLDIPETEAEARKRHAINVMNQNVDRMLSASRAEESARVIKAWLESRKTTIPKKEGVLYDVV